MLTVRTLATAEGVTVADATCRDEPRRGVAEQVREHALVLVRRGVFATTGTHGRAVVDPTLGYTLAPGDEHRYDHPHGPGDDCTYISLAPTVVDSLTAGGGRLPAGIFPTSPALYLAQRRLLTLGRRGDCDALVEEVLELAARVISLGTVPSAADGPRTVAAKRRQEALAAAAREYLALDPGLTLTALARAVGVSPHHLSRLFRRWSGTTVSDYRMRLRARAALDRIADGERDLAALAADLGLADQSHLNRLLRRELDRTPTQLRRLVG